MPILEERMIYKVGKSSLAITLPRGWLRYLGLQPGDKVEIEVNGELTIRPLKRQGNGKTQISGQANS